MKNKRLKKSVRQLIWVIAFALTLVTGGFGGVVTTPLVSAESFSETGDAGNTTGTSQAIDLDPGTNTLSGAFATGDDIDFYALTFPVGGLITFSASPSTGGMGYIPILSLFKPDGTLYMANFQEYPYFGPMIALIPAPGTWFLVLSVYRDFPTRYFPSQVVAGGNGGTQTPYTNGDGGVILPGEYAIFKPYSPAVGDSSFAVPNLPPDTPGFEYTISISLPTTIQLQIDIKPGSLLNNVNPKSNGKIPIAILSTDDFDAPSQVDLNSLTFGETGDEQSLAFCNHKGEDINGDQLKDLICHFYTQDTGFQCGDTEGVLKGMTMDGTPIEGSDFVKIVPCKK
jgi:hypothetical protein